MAYNQELADRIMRRISVLPGFSAKKMFGGVGYMIYGNMACGVSGERLIVRVGEAQHAAAMAMPHTGPFDTYGKSMAGWIMVDPAGCESDEDLHRWLEQGLAYARTLPPK